MQPKISAFFKPSPSQISSIPSQLSHPIHQTPTEETTDPSQIRITYKRRPPKPNPNSNDKDGGETVERTLCTESADALVKTVPNSGRNLNKKRSYAQLHLEFGQSDFLLHTCSTCGLMFARGVEGDEKVHKEFHKNYTHGVPFKGWRNERVVSVYSSEGSRIILVLDSDLPAHRNKVQEVGKMMEAELGLIDSWLIHKLCKVYLFISGQRIAGCLVTEPIKSAYKVLSNSVVQKDSSSSTPTADGLNSTLLQFDTTKDRSNSSTLQFGTISFQQETVKRAPSVSRPDLLEQDLDGAVFCEEEAVSAICGVRAIWVTPYNRRKHVATKLLNAARISFCKDYVVELSQMAFSQPTSLGKALASRYSGKGSFLVYHTGLNC